MPKKKLHIKNLKHIAFLLPSLAGVMIFIFIPFLDSVRRSFCAAVSGKPVGLRNYKVIFQNEAFLLALKNTALFIAACLPLLIASSFLIAYCICRLKYVRLIRSVLLFPLAVPTAVLMLVWQVLFSDFGYINNILLKCGFDNVSFLHSSAAFWVLVGSYIWKNLGYTTLLWSTGIMGVSTNIIEAARVDGAGEWKILAKIIFPSLRPTLYTITIISFLNSFKVFREAYLVAGAYPHESIYLLQHLFNNWFNSMDLDKMAAAAVTVFMIIFAAITFLRRAWDKELYK